MLSIANVINEYGFPIVAVFFLAYFIFYLWKFITEQITPKLSSTSATLIKLIDRIRMMDNDLIRLQTKVHTIKKKK